MGVRMIYAIEALGSGFVKFGYSGAGVNERLNTMQTGCPYELVVRAVAEWPSDTEFAIHLHLSEEHERGEWFRLGPKAQAVIEAMNLGGLWAWQDHLAKTAPRRLQHHFAGLKPVE